MSDGDGPQGGAPQTGRQDLLAGLVMLAVVAIFWVQRDYMTPFGGMFPDRIMVLLAVASAGLAARAAWGVAAGKPSQPQPQAAPTGASDAGAGSGETSGGSPVASTAVILGLWVALMIPLGFILGSILCFSLLAWWLAGRPASLRAVATTAAVATASVLVLYWVFARLLAVPLPVGRLFGA